MLVAIGNAHVVGVDELLDGVVVLADGLVVPI